MTAPAARPYGVVAEFDTAERLLEAARAAHRAGFRDVEGFSPFPVEGLDEVLEEPPSRLTAIALVGGVGAATGFFLLQAYAMGISYPFDIGGRPLFSWPSYVLSSFAVGILGAVVSSVLGMLYLNRLPRLHHPIFEHKGFIRVTQDRFFLRIGPDHERFDEARIREVLGSSAPLSLRTLQL
ncbi:DUF3341 domain-containing protein [Marinivivus vitaminiproducens]|uniref:DUF3341 domain-containing protein n=1 Tax=Marinivivus vitaminiproducens TaxID=3035935 RepID=UPI0027A16A6D|nr:DUF3341 domain-containing protein [Geminicoccaceae bacterium SCSIO 64248]